MPTTLVTGLFDLYARIRQVTPLRALNRIAIAVYDGKSDLLRTFSHAGDGDSPLSHYVARLSEVPSLRAIADSGRPRVVDDMTQLYDRGRAHGQRLLDSGLRSSYTVPLLTGGQLTGFLFFNATEAHYFTPTVLHQLWPYAQIAGFVARSELEKIQVIQAAVSTVRQISAHRDEETGAHLERMSRYTRLIAEELAESRGLGDEYIEFLFQFAPLHDVGKVAIPDNILLKPARLDEEEFAVMKTHVSKGRDIIDIMMADFGALAQVSHIGVLRNVVSCHHEAWDGSGYPQGLAGEAIPLEARITAVADVFDALTSARPYKAAWSNDRAFGFLEENAGIKFDPACVAALLARRADVEEVQRQFDETRLG